MQSLSIEYNIDTARVDTCKRYRPFSFMSDAQEIANHHASAIGFGYDDLIKGNSAWVLSRMHVRFLRRPSWEEDVRLTTWHKGRDGVLSLRDFEVTDKKGDRILIQATSSWLIIDINSRRMIRPDRLPNSSLGENSLDRDAISTHCGKIAAPPEMKLIGCHKVLYSDLDFNSHTNNAKYMEWAMDALYNIEPESVIDREIEEYRINFIHESHFGEEILIYGGNGPDGRERYIEGRSSSGTIFQTLITLNNE